MAIVPMPLNLAVFGSDCAQDVIAAYPQIQHWAVGGHSLGGAMAAHFVYQHPGVIQGLALWAAYPANGDDLSRQSLKVVYMIGSQDGLGTAKEVDATRSLLPQNARFVVIDGGNHPNSGGMAINLATTRLPFREQISKPRSSPPRSSCWGE